MSRNPMEQNAIYRAANRQAAAVIASSRERYLRIIQIWAERVLGAEANKSFQCQNDLAPPEAEIALASTIAGAVDHRGGKQKVATPGGCNAQIRGRQHEHEAGALRVVYRCCPVQIRSTGRTISGVGDVGGLFQIHAKRNRRTSQMSVVRVPERSMSSSKMNAIANLKG
jgi:hypothetical protein